MKKQRKYLKDLIPISINRLVLESGYFEVRIGDTLLSLNPERHPNGRYYIALFRNHLRQREAWELSAMPHRGHLRNGGSIPYRCDERYFVVSHGRRYRHLFIDPETMTVGTRSDFFSALLASVGYPRFWLEENGKRVLIDFCPCGCANGYRDHMKHKKKHRGRGIALSKNPLAAK